ncbi:MAG: hypothetical protein ACI8YQ_003006 [Polaribacter sp.]|jgi:hypothetical protein
MKNNALKFLRSSGWISVVFLFWSFTTGNNQVAQTMFEGSRSFGDFIIEYQIKYPGYVTDCTLKLSNEIVGLSTLNANNNKFIFDVLIDNNYAKGQLSAQLYPSNQYSTLEGDFNYGQINTQDSITGEQRFRGTVVGWFTIDSPNNE